MSGEMKSWALWNARRGFRVFPLKPGGKTPAHKGWQQEATTDEAEIQRLWNGTDYNVGVATGDGLVVIDVDVKDGRPGFETFQSLAIPDATFAVATPSGGRHLYYRGPDVRNSVQSLGPGVDVRGVGGYVVGPGSVIDGKQYVVSSKSPLLVLDDSRLQVGRERNPDRDVATPAVPLDTPQAIARATAYLKTDAPLAVEGAGGDHTTFKVACAIKDMGVSRYTAWELLDEHWNDRCSPPWSLEDLERKVNNAFLYGVEAPGSATPEASFGDVRIEPPPRLGRPWFYHGDTPNLDEAWLFHQLLPATGVALIVGPTGAGKTFLETHLARCLATGKPFFGVTPDEKGGSLFLFAGTEGSGFALRLAALQEPEPLAIAYTPVSGLRERGALDALLEDLKAQQAYMLEKYGVPLRVVFLETLSASGLLSDENDNAEAAQAIANLAQIGAALGVLIVTSHHPPKNGVGSRGAEALPSNSDYVLEIRRQGKERIRELALTKARNSEERKVGAFSLVPVEIGIDKRGRPVVSMVISTGEKSAEVERKSAHLEKFIQCVEHTLLDGEALVESVDGVDSVLEDDVRAEFRERILSEDKYKSLKDRGNFTRAFKKVKLVAEDMGAIATVIHKGKTFLQLRTIEL